MDKTTHLYKLEKFDIALVESIIEEVALSLKERGYDPVNQLVGYLMSGDPGYISTYKDARRKITSIERSMIIEVLLRKGLK